MCVTRWAPPGGRGRTLVLCSIICGVKIPGFSQLPLPLSQGWPPTVGVITREYGTGHTGSGHADERHFEELTGTTCTVLMGYAEGPTARSAPRRICIWSDSWELWGELRVAGASSSVQLSACVGGLRDGSVVWSVVRSLRRGKTLWVKSCVGSVSQCPPISHVIPPRLFQTLNCVRRNCNVFGCC